MLIKIFVNALSIVSSEEVNISIYYALDISRLHVYCIAHAVHVFQCHMQGNVKDGVSHPLISHNPALHSLSSSKSIYRRCLPSYRTSAPYIVRHGQTLAVHASANTAPQ